MVSGTFLLKREEAEVWILGLFGRWRGEAPFDEVWCGIG